MAPKAKPVDKAKQQAKAKASVEAAGAGQPAIRIDIWVAALLLLKRRQYLCPLYSFLALAWAGAWRHAHPSGIRSQHAAPACIGMRQAQPAGQASSQPRPALPPRGFMHCCWLHNQALAVAPQPLPPLPPALATTATAAACAPAPKLNGILPAPPNRLLRTRPLA